jgi:hypothetical protein
MDVFITLLACAKAAILDTTKCRTRVPKLGEFPVEVTNGKGAL